MSERTEDEHGGVRVRLGGSNQDHEHHSPNTWTLKWAETIGNPECPLMKRWVLETPIGSIRLHHFLHSDDARALHDHPWPFMTIPLSPQGYFDMTYCPVCKGQTEPVAVIGGRCGECMESGFKLQHVPAWLPTFRSSGHAHAVTVDERGCWTFILTGRKTRHWGFWTKWVDEPLKFFDSRGYFKLFGHAPCED